MLDLMRRQSYLIYLVFGGIIFIFAVNFGPGQSGCASTPKQLWAAKVDGEVIRHHDFSMMYMRQLEYLRRLAERRGGEFDPAMAERMGLPKQVLDQLVDRKILARQAAERGLLITDDELREYLREQYGVKDVSYETYEGWVTRTFDTSTAKFEEEARGDVAAQHMARLVTDTLTIGDDELKGEFLRDRDRATLDFVRFDPEPEQVAEPPKAVIEKMLASDMTAIEAQYGKNIAQYRTPAQVRLRQIVRTLPAGLPSGAEGEKVVAAAQEALEAARKRLAAGEDFAKVAADVSQDEPTAKLGGDLGWLAAQELAKPLAEATAKLSPGGLTEQAVRTPHGLHLLQLVERKDAHSRELPEVKQEVAVSLYKDRIAQEAAQKKAIALLMGLRKGKVLSALTQDEDTLPVGAKKKHAKPALPLRRRTSWIKRSDAAVSRLGPVPELRADLFAEADAALRPGQPLPRVYPAADSYVVAVLHDRELPDLKDFEREKEDLREQAVEVKRNRVLHDWLAFLRGKSKVQMNPKVFGGRGVG